MRIVALNQVDLPGAHIVLQCFLALNRFIDIAEFFVPDEQMDFVMPCEFRSNSRAVLIDTSDQSIGDADVQCATRWLARM